MPIMPLTPFARLVATFQQLEGTARRLEMFALLADLFREAGDDEIDKIIYFIQGDLLPAFHGVDLGLSDKLLLRAIAKTYDIAPELVAAEYRRIGDIGATVAQYATGTGAAQSVGEIYDAITAIATMSGEGSVERKIDAVCDLFRASSPPEAKYIARFIAGKLRLGVGDATVLSALARFLSERLLRPIVIERRGFGIDEADVLAALAPPLTHLLLPLFERAYHITSDLGLIAKVACQEGASGLRNLSVRVGYPIRPALCERATSAAEIVERLGRCAVEVKYDGFRCQAHKSKDGATLFSRNQERTTTMFPEIVAAVEEMFGVREAILEGEVLAFDPTTGAPLPFQITSQRKRKHGVDAMARDLPLRFFIFDLLALNGEDWTGRPYADRRAKVAALLAERTTPDPTLTLAEAMETADAADIEDFFESALARGFEGIVAKRLDAPYAAGARNFNWIKLKRSGGSGGLADTLDLCIVGYFVGQGHRAKFGIGTILAAAYDPAQDRFFTVSKIGSGFSEAELVRLKEMLDEAASPECSPQVCSEIIPDVWVHPKYVVAVTADEITRSKIHTAGSAPGDTLRAADDIDGDTSGYALRFPRVLGFIREDKSARDATTVEEVVALFQKQPGPSGKG